MDRRVLFLSVFIFTLISTMLVFFVCLYVGQGWFDTVLYTLAAMWVTGVVSQILIQHLYLGVVRPVEEAKYEMKLAHAKAKINIDEVEEIDQVEELEAAKAEAQEVERGSR